MEIKVIKNEAEYDRALTRVDDLMDAKAGTSEGDELELLVTLIGLYEDKIHPIDLPDPLEAIRFRMDQSGLRQQDLVPYLGSRSRVSEVMNGKRPLTLKMIRALHTGLKIPLEVLLQEPKAEDVPTEDVQWERFPVIEMAKRGWFREFRKKPGKARESAEKLMRSFLGRTDSYALAPGLLKQHIRSGSEMDEYALAAWRARVLQLASEQSKDTFSAEKLVADLRPLVQLSYLADGPRLAQEYLAKCGVALVVLGHLPRTHLDGAALMSPDGHPVVALTLRHDRLDNFWFTLLHELGHVVLHLVSAAEPGMFVDDLSPGTIDLEQVEKEADTFAAETLIPEAEWREFAQAEDFSPRSADLFADTLRISPAIVAGRIRRETGNYRLLAPTVGYGSIRTQFQNLRGTQGPTN
jgi:HTH-type transcriptional regulator/antitoxin HigA